MKTYKLNPKPVRDEKDPETGEIIEVEVDVHPEDRTVIITEEIEQSLLDQLPESIRNEVNQKSEERVTIANLKQEHEQAIESVKQAIKKANEIAQKINTITSEFPELEITGAGSEILNEDKIKDLDSKKPVQRTRKEQ